MSPATDRTWGSIPTRAAAAAAALSLLAIPIPAGAHGQSQTVMLTLTDGISLSQLADRVTALGGQVLNTLEVADSLLVRLPQGAALPAGTAVVPDTPMKVNGKKQQYHDTTEPTYLKTIKAAADSAAGSGSTIALLDTGVDPDAHGLAHVEHINVTDAADGDGHGHGTFQAGLIGGRGYFPGVAPGAHLIDVQVADENGATSLYDVLAGVDAVADRGDVDVLNISLSTESALPPSFDPLTRALERLWESGVLVVAAAGNDGPKPGTVGSPGNDPLLLTIGAVDEYATAERGDDSLAVLSSRGSEFTPGKPELAAPGISLISTAAAGSGAARDTAWTSEDGHYLRGSGTSMAASIVSASAAVILAQHPQLEPNGLKALLTSTGYDIGGTTAALDLQAALAAAGSAPVNPEQVFTNDDDWGPAESDAQAWAAFGAAWESGDFRDVKAAWKDLSWQTKQWASRVFSLSVIADSATVDEQEFLARSWAARSWAFDGWMARSWAARSWASDEDWSARSWAARSWAARSWAARSWATDEWLARSWAARSWAARSWAARSWAARSWAARSWAARSWASDEGWSARSWAARSWAARSWASDDGWAARSWAARSWATGTWHAGSWSMTR